MKTQDTQIAAINDIASSPSANTGDKTRVSSNRESPPGIPRWLKVFGIIVIGLIVLFVILQFTGVGGQHGPAMHMPPSIGQQP